MGLRAMAFRAASFALSFALAAACGFMASLLWTAWDSPPSPAPGGDARLRAAASDPRLMPKRGWTTVSRADGIRAAIAAAMAGDIASGSGRTAAAQIPRVRIGGGELELTVDVNAPIMGMDMVRPLAFTFRSRSGALELAGARLGGARIPLLAARGMFASTLDSYIAGPSTAEAAEIFKSFSSVEIDGETLVMRP